MFHGQPYHYGAPASGSAQSYPPSSSYTTSSAPIAASLPPRPTNTANYTVDMEIPYPEGYVPKPKTASDDKAKKKLHSSSAPAASSSSSSSLYPAASQSTPNYAAAFAKVAAKKGGEEKKKKKLLRAAGGEVWEDPTLQEWDRDDFRIFCGDLGNEVNDDLLQKAFSKYPSLQKVKVVRDKKTLKSKGYGFVSFKDPNDFVKALKEMNGKYVGNRPIKLRKSTWDERNADPRALRKTVGGAVVKK
ncbi:hypothetical protein HDV05_006283 [Chytridiales sp. JEL 0842]|nr:hypothetical protein HDV05_006283 [Chytridiales sp. JEL 0842]